MAKHGCVCLFANLINSEGQVTSYCGQVGKPENVSSPSLQNFVPCEAILWKSCNETVEEMTVPREKTTVFTTFCATSAATRYKSRPTPLELDTSLKTDGHRSLYNDYKLFCILSLNQVIPLCIDSIYSLYYIYIFQPTQLYNKSIG